MADGKSIIGDLLSLRFTECPGDIPEFYDYSKLSNDKLCAPRGKFRVVVHDLDSVDMRTSKEFLGEIHYYHMGDYELLDEAKGHCNAPKPVCTRYVIYDDTGHEFFRRYGPVVETDVPPRSGLRRETIPQKIEITTPEV